MNLEQTILTYLPVKEMHFYIRKEDGKHCVHSHQTGKNFGCYESVGQAKKRLAQMKRFRAERDVKAQEMVTAPGTGGMGRAKALDL
jgi:hypothetical protein